MCLNRGRDFSLVLLPTLGENAAESTTLIM